MSMDGNNWRVVGYERLLRTPARLVLGGGEGGNKLGGVFPIRNSVNNNKFR
jgi:hypothetical protein